MVPKLYPGYSLTNGWPMIISNFLQKTKDRVKNLAQILVDLCLKHDFDGLTLDADQNNVDIIQKAFGKGRQSDLKLRILFRNCIRQIS